jgi:hypothetical protein
MLEGGPEAVAAFLAKTEGLDKTVIGDYLGERDDFNLKVQDSARALGSHAHVPRCRR